MDQVDLEKHIEAIQKGLKRSGRVMVLSGTQAMIRGICISAGTIPSFCLLGRPRWQMLVLWICVILAMLSIEALMYFRLSRKNPDKYISGIEMQILKFGLLLLLVGIAFSAALSFHGAPSMIPGLWMIIAGIIYMICGFFSFSRTWVLGILACVGGCASLFLPPFCFFIILGTILGLGSIAYGVVMKTMEKDSE
ncbi:MAG: hypothetical protein E3J72_07500 [Planctomycetota bacterium]|nr:MAG: hypothetical protein E3J72_07500 [Planctomycetota bacterium]